MNVSCYLTLDFCKSLEKLAPEKINHKAITRIELTSKSIVIFMGLKKVELLISDIKIKDTI